MARPTSISAASWIWMLGALFTTFTIANVLTATEMLVGFTGMSGAEEDLQAGVVISWFGWLMAVFLLAAMTVQVVAAVKLRDGARWARLVLTVVAFFCLLGVITDITMISAWLLLAANVVAVVLVYGQSASDFLAPRDRDLVAA